MWLLTLVFMASCSVERPEEILSDEQMEQVLYDYHIARAVGEEFASGENYRRQLFVEDAFRKNGITQAEFDISMTWFARYPQHLIPIYEKVNKRLREKRDGIGQLIAMRNEKPKDTAPGDSVDVWMWQRVYALPGTPLDNRISFHLPSDTNFQARDTLRWTIRFRFPEGVPDTLHAPLMAMQVAYEKDSVISTWQHVDTAGVHTLTLFADTLGAIKEVSGFVYMPSQPDSGTLLADHIMLMRYHANDSLYLQVDTLKGKQPKKIELKGEKSLTPANSPKPQVQKTNGRIMIKNVK